MQSLSKTSPNKLAGTLPELVFYNPQAESESMRFKCNHIHAVFSSIHEISSTSFLLFFLIADPGFIIVFIILQFFYLSQNWLHAHTQHACAQSCAWTHVLCLMEMGAWGGQEASDGNRTHSFRILMRFGVDSSDAEVTRTYTVTQVCTTAHYTQPPPLWSLSWLALACIYH